MKGLGKVIVLGGLMLALTGCVSEDTLNEIEKAVNETQEDTQENTQDNEQEKNDNTALLIGDTGEIGNFKIVLLGIEEYNSEDVFPAEEGKKYVRAQFVFQNVGKEEEAISSLFFSGYVREQSVPNMCIMMTDQVLEGDVPPGEKMKGYIYFEVPEDAESLRVEYVDNLLADEVVVYKGDISEGNKNQNNSQNNEDEYQEYVEVDENDYSGYENYEEYMIPNSDIYLVNDADTRYLSAEELRIARNEIYARHGYIFKDPALNEYFLQQSWYVPRYTINEWNENWLNETEKANVQFIKKIEAMIQ